MSWVLIPALSIKNMECWGQFVLQIWPLPSQPYPFTTLIPQGPSKSLSHWTELMLLLLLQWCSCSEYQFRQGAKQRHVISLRQQFPSLTASYPHKALDGKKDVTWTHNWNSVVRTWSTKEYKSEPEHKVSDHFGKLVNDRPLEFPAANATLCISARISGLCINLTYFPYVLLWEAILGCDAPTQIHQSFSVLFHCMLLPCSWIPEVFSHGISSLKQKGLRRLLMIEYHCERYNTRPLERNSL